MEKRRVLGRVAMLAGAIAVGATALTGPASAAVAQPNAWFFHKSYSSQVACVASIPAEILKYHPAGVQCVPGINGAWNMDFED